MEKIIKPTPKILSVLATHREYEQYKMPKATGLSYRTILRYLKPLEKDGLIKLIRMEESEKGGKERKIYSLTLRGLLNSLFLSPEHWKQMEKIAEVHGDKLFVLEKWRFFEKEQIADRIRAYMFSALTAFAINRILLRNLAEEVSEDKLRHYVDSNTLLVAHLSLKGQNLGKHDLEVIKILLKDSDIKHFIISELENDKRKMQKRESKITEALKWINA